MKLNEQGRIFSAINFQVSNQNILIDTLSAGGFQRKIYQLITGGEKD